MAASANLTHGPPLKSSEVRAAFRVYIQTKQHRKGKGRLKSFREMAQELGRSHNTIRNWMTEDFPGWPRSTVGTNQEEMEGCNHNHHNHRQPLRMPSVTWSRPVRHSKRPPALSPGKPSGSSLRLYMMNSWRTGRSPWKTSDTPAGHIWIWHFPGQLFNLNSASNKLWL